MKFAFVNNEKSEAQKGLKGICPICGENVIAKCGTKKINHWAHCNKTKCDVWKEHETAWHREWKNNFPNDWQEVITRDKKTGEKHIADVRTPSGIVLEFQHSPIDPKEQSSREKYYQNLIWIVDCSKVNDKKRIQKEINENAIREILPNDGIWMIRNEDEYLPGHWCNRPVMVIYDYKDNNDDRLLLCKYPGIPYIIQLEKTELVNSIINPTMKDGLFNKISKLKIYYQNQLNQRRFTTIRRSIKKNNRL